jgi:hypothetical protein
MKTPSFFEGIGVALAGCFVAGVLHAVLSPLVGSGCALRLLVAGIGFVYVIYLIRRAPERCGRVTTVALWCAIALAMALLSPPLSFYLLVHLGMIWLVRSLYFYSGLLSALADMGLVAFGFTAAVWALLHAGSMFLAFWCFFLAQALFVAIPANLKRAPDATFDSQDGFQHAHRTAEAALRRLSSTR